jgi:hypothetical protein
MHYSFQTIFCFKTQLLFLNLSYGCLWEIEACNFRIVTFFQTDWQIYYLLPRPNLFTAKILQFIFRCMNMELISI